MGAVPRRLLHDQGLQADAPILRTDAREGRAKATDPPSRPPKRHPVMEVTSTASPDSASPGCSERTPGFHAKQMSSPSVETHPARPSTAVPPTVLHFRTRGGFSTAVGRAEDAPGGSVQRGTGFVGREARGCWPPGNGMGAGVGIVTPVGRCPGRSVPIRRRHGLRRPVYCYTETRSATPGEGEGRCAGAPIPRNGLASCAAKKTVRLIQPALPNCAGALALCPVSARSAEH